LVVDDDVAFADNLAEIFEIDGHATQVAASAEEAFAKALENEPDVVVTDYCLPGMNGAAFVKQLRATRTRIHAMVISAYTDDMTVGEVTDAGASFLAKPVDVRRLNRWISEPSP
jgi:DNA-binding response OmpR family regulator